MNSVMSRFYPVPDEPITIQHLFEFMGMLGVILPIGLGAWYLVRWLFPSTSPGEVITANLATYWIKPQGQDPTPANLATAKQYDYIIIGTGTAGCVLARRLSEDPKVSVLAIEAGHSDLKQLYSRIPAGYANLHKTDVDYDIKTTPQKELKDRVLDCPRGKMLGGSSAINPTIFTRGPPSDYDEWESLGNPNWSYSSIRPFFSKSESFHQNPQYPFTDQDLSQHGSSGPWKTGYRTAQPSTHAFVDACQGFGIEKVDDFNTHNGTNGAGIFQTFIDPKGQRSSTAAAFLTPDVVARRNLTISVGKSATRILFDSPPSNTSTPLPQEPYVPRAIGVELGSASPGTNYSFIRYIVAAKKEIILCAGAVHTPQLLQVSGIGPRAELERLEIPVVKDLPAVGQNLADHLVVPLVAKTAKGTSLQHLCSKMSSLPYLAQWFLTGRGPLSTPLTEGAAFLRLADRPDAPESLRNNDLTSGKTASDIEILSAAAGVVNHGTKLPTDQDVHSLCTILLRPESRGSVKLASNSVFDKPVVDANYLSTKHDRKALVYGVKLSRDIFTSTTFSQFFRGWAWPCPSASGQDADVRSLTDAELEDFVRSTAQTLSHFMCTARMGPDEKDSVVDSKLKVHGVEGLRIADASVFPAPLSCHPTAGVVMVGERCAEFIREGWWWLGKKKEN